MDVLAKRHFYVSVYIQNAKLIFLNENSKYLLCSDINISDFM